MFVLFLSIFIAVCLILMVVVLLQSSKGGGLAGAFGGGGSDSSVMGGRSAASFLSKITVYLAGSFMALALLLSILSSRSLVTEEDSVIRQRQQKGALDVYDVQKGNSILDDIQTEGFNPAESGNEGDQGAPAEGEGNDAEGK